MYAQKIMGFSLIKKMHFFINYHLLLRSVGVDKSQVWHYYVIEIVVLFVSQKSPFLLVDKYRNDTHIGIYAVSVLICF